MVTSASVAPSIKRPLPLGHHPVLGKSLLPSYRSIIHPPLFPRAKTFASNQTGAHLDTTLTHGESAQTQAKDDVTGDLEFSGCSSSITTSSSSPSPDDGMGMYAWNALSPVADWGPFCPDDGGQDLHGLIESMLCDDTLVGAAGDLHPAMFFPDEAYCCSNGSAPSSTTTTNPGTP
ncbi:hypothetical protein C2845_PM10G22070 [Panicum miliaceum]|uniref:Uncharacterized protein n=1 Tax=Panicum miliaceum TaxID=4540 RepID=A0A3L6PEM6_PANMI|nr:hypothetical protein C2845_PM10G22070 [Panicum miliaceum]